MIHGAPVAQGAHPSGAWPALHRLRPQDRRRLSPVPARREAERFPDVFDEQVQQALDQAPQHPNIPHLAEEMFTAETDKEKREHCWAGAASVRDAALAGCNPY